MFSPGAVHFYLWEENKFSKEFCREKTHKKNVFLEREGMMKEPTPVRATVINFAHAREMKRTGLGKNGNFLTSFRWFSGRFLAVPSTSSSILVFHSPGDTVFSKIPISWWFSCMFIISVCCFSFCFWCDSAKLDRFSVFVDYLRFFKWFSLY